MQGKVICLKMTADHLNSLFICKYNFSKNLKKQKAQIQELQKKGYSLEAEELG